MGYFGDFCGQRGGEEKEGDEKWQEREGRAVSVADGGFRCSVLRISCDSQANIMVVAVPDAVGVLAELGHEVTAAQSFDDLLGRLAPPGTRAEKKEKKKREQKVPRTSTVGVPASSQLLRASFFRCVVLGRCLEENKGLHTLSDGTESKSGGKWILTRLQETQTETNVLNPPRHHRLKIASWPW